MGNATCPNNSNNNQTPAGYIWPTGYYPMHGNNHSANLIGAELYIQEQQMKAQQREEGREFAAKYPGIALTLRVIFFVIVLFCILVGFVT